jgi:hypothetical protein
LYPVEDKGNIYQDMADSIRYFSVGIKAGQYIYLTTAPEVGS